MNSPTQIVVTLVRTMKGGSRLLGAITDVSPTDGGYLDIEFHTDFQSSGGDFVIEPGTANEEIGSYTSLDKWNDRLLGIVRPDPKAHPDGAIVWAGIEPYEEKLVDGLVDGDMTQIALGIPVRSEVSTFLKPGAYVAGENAPVVWVWATDEDGDDPWVQTAPFGAKPTVGSDLATMTPVGGGDSSGATTDPTTGKVLPPKGMGFEDGDVPTGTVVAEAFGGIGNVIHVNFTTIANSSVVNYDVHVSTSTGFTPGPGTLYSSHSFAGEPDFLATATIKDFPATHDLDGTASDPPVPGTDYFIVVIPRDGSGEGTPSAEVSATPVVTVPPGSITETEIADDSISTPKLQANSVTTNELAARTIVAGNVALQTLTAAEVAIGSLTADRLNVSTLSAISANLGTVTAGSLSAVTISGATITGGTVRTAASGERVEMASAAVNYIKWYNSAGSSYASINGIPGSSEIFVSATSVRLSNDVIVGGSAGTVGFYGLTGVTRQSRALLSGSDSTTAQLHAKVNGIITDLTDLGLISS